MHEVEEELGGREAGTLVDVMAAGEDRPRLLYSRNEAAYQLSISARAVDYLIAKKELAVRRMGKKILVPHSELVKFARKDHRGVATD
jgi:excisionase family DNA binding protein